MVLQDQERQTLIRAIALSSSLQGDFLLRSGAKASTYFDKYQFEAQPDLLRPLARWMGSLLDDRAELLAGLELGGIPLATAISLDRGIPTVFVRKHAKSYGTLKAIEGPSVSGRYVVVIEDVVTTGGATIESVAKLRDAGAIVEKVVCAIWRGTDLVPLRAAGLDLRWALERKDLDAISCSR